MKYILILLLFFGCSKKQVKPEMEAPPTSLPAPTVQQQYAEINDYTEPVTLEKPYLPAFETIYFDLNKYFLKDKYFEDLHTLAEWMNGNNEGITIEGHCCDLGSNEYNMVLGQRRADIVKTFLTNHDIDPYRISTISYGEERPASEIRSLNRRVEIYKNQGE